MATKTPATKDIETVEQVEEQELLQIVDVGIKAIVAAHDINIQKNRYKAMRAIAWQAFIEHIEAGDFDTLVERASANVGNLPTGWTVNAPKRAPKLERAAKRTPEAPTSQTKVQKAAATRKPRATKGSTVATAEGVIIAEQRHVDG